MPRIEPYLDTNLPDRFRQWIEQLRRTILTIPTFSIGDGSPEGVVNGALTDRYYDRTATDNGSRLYVKTIDGGNTGWALYDSKANVPDWFVGAGSPEGVVTADIPARYYDTTGAQGFRLYVKTVNGGNTGWVAYDAKPNVPDWSIGAGDPEGVVVGALTARYYNTAGDRGSRLFVKTVDGGNTGWQSYDSSGSAALGNWVYRTTTTPNPTAGRVHFDNLTVGSATNVYFHKLNNNGTDVSLFFGALVSGDEFYMQDQADAASRLVMTMGVPSFADPVWTFPITSITVEGTALSQNDIIGVAKL